MKKLLGITILSLLMISNAFSNEKFSNWINSLGLEKTIFQDNIFYMGIGYTGEPNYLKNTFPILVSFIYDEVYSDDKRYVIRSGCKPRDCDGNNGMIWVDLKEKVAIGVINHSFWEKLDFDNMVEGQIFIFSNFYESHMDFPEEFKASYSKWLKEIEVTPSKYRFLNSRNKLMELENFK